MKQNQIENIGTHAYEKKFRVGSDECQVIIEDALYGDWRGKREPLDEPVLHEMCRELVTVLERHTTKYNPLPKQLCIRHSEVRTNQNETPEILSVIEPRYRLEEIALPQETKEQLQVTLSAVKNSSRLAEEWGLSQYFSGNRAVILNFYGQAGTGKSMTAEAIAGYLGKKVLLVNYSELESKYVGETPKNIRNVFAKACREDAVLVFDEADSFLSKRLTSITQSADYGVNITRSVMLMELEHFDGIAVFTTNLIQNYDTAFKRRIFASVEFRLPDQAARAEIWKLHIGSRLPVGIDVSAESLAEHYENLSGADIRDIVYYAAVYAMDKGKGRVEKTDFDRAYQFIIRRYTE